jgi:hypothetical protein
MAYIEYSGRVQLRDEHQLLTTKLVAIRIDDAIVTTEAARLAAAMSALNDFVAALDDIVDPIIVTTTLTIPIVVAGIKSSAGDQSVAEGANLVLSTVDDDGVHERPYWLPGAVAGVFLANFATVDTADTDLNTWVSTFNAASGVEIVISDGEVVQAVTGGRYASRKRESNLG